VQRFTDEADFRVTNSSGIVKKEYSMKKRIGLSAKMLIGMILGIAAGFIVGPQIAVIKPFGTAFVNLLKMVMVPIVMVSITLSIAKVDNLKKFGRLGIKTFLFYCVTTMIAAVVSLCYSGIIMPGVNFSGQLPGEPVKRTIPSAADTVLGIIPTNIVQSMANASLVSIIFFCIVFGCAVALIGDKKAPLVAWLESLNSAIMKMISLCLQYAPIGVFALMANMSGVYGLDTIKSLGKFILADYLGFLTQFFVVYGIILAVFTRISIFKFILRVRQVIITAATTLSSNATVPVELELSESHLGVPQNVGGFMFPFGATVNQNGTAINITCCVIFSAQVYGVQFTAPELIILISLALISSIGNAGIPAGGTVFTLMILNQFGIPSEAFGLIIAVYSLVDLGSTTMNICGDMVGAIYVCKSEKILNEKVWHPDYRIEQASA
jgi:Na+/H+-dicarboxylate symporter